MATTDDLAAIREELIKGLKAKAGTGLKSITINGKTMVYHTPKEMLDALNAVLGSDASGGSPTTFVEVSDL